VVTEALGFALECFQWATEWGNDYRSGFSEEDLPSNSAGAGFGDDFINDKDKISESFRMWCALNGARDHTDPASGYDRLPDFDPAAPISSGGAGGGCTNVSSDGPGRGSSNGTSDASNKNSGGSIKRSVRKGSSCQPCSGHLGSPG
jgi:hypothetical protein